MRIGQVDQLTRGILQDIVFLLEKILFRERVRSKLLEYTTVVDIACEHEWIQNILIEMDFVSKILMRIYSDNRSIIYIIQNVVLHERTKHTFN